MTSGADRMHPRPMLARGGWVDLCGEWSFAYDDAGVGLLERWQERSDVFDRTIVVPFPPESPASGIGDPGFHPVVWYRRTLRHAARPGRRVRLHFGAVDYRAQVWVNGQHVVRHEGGHTPFSADITAALGSGTEHEVVVRAEDRPDDMGQPRGKQDWQEEPHAIWYARTTGIWQPVWMEDLPDTNIRSVHWTPDVERSSLCLSVRFHRTQGPLRLRVRLRLRDQLLADDTYAVVGPELTRTISLPQTGVTLGRSEMLWSPEAPNLIDATLTLLDDDGVVDEVTSYTAMRSVAASKDRLLLNGRPYYLRLVLAQGFWPQSHLAAPSEDALRREVELAKELGFNGLRLHQKVEDPRLLAWCDRLGLLVWSEMPAAYEYSTTSVERLTREWLEVLERDYSHPCIVAWVPVNESWGVPSLETSPAQQALVRSLYHLTKALDPTRLVIGNDGWEQVVTDVITVHDYTASGSVLRDRYGDHEALERTLARTQPGYRLVLLPGTSREEEPVVISEFGGITLDSSQRSSWWGYGGVRTAEELHDSYRDLVEALLASPAVVGFCYTQLTDVQQERNGLLTEDREPKVDPARIRWINTRPPAAVPADAIGPAAYGVAPPEDTERTEAL